MTAAAMTALASCGGASTESTDLTMIDKPDFTSVDRVFGVEALEALGRVTEPQVSPDGKKVLYGISYESVDENRSNRDLYVINIDGTDPVRITSTPSSENNACWLDEGKRIAYLSGGQLWIMNADGTAAQQIGNIEGGIDGFRISPDGLHVVMIKQVKYGRTAQEIYPDLPKATGRVIDDLMYKHWDEWVTTVPHPFVADIDGNELINIRDIMQDEPYEAPMKPFGGIESLAWAPDSKSLVYVSRKKTGMEYALSTNSDLYRYDLATGKTDNLTEGMMGYDTAPVFSPDGTKLAWLSMEHDGYESDKNRIFVLDLATGEKTDLTADWDYTVDAIAWHPSCKSLFFLAPLGGVIPVFSIDVESHEVKVVAEAQADYADLSVAPDGTLVTMCHSMIAPNDIYSISPAGEQKRLTDVNADVLSQVDMPKVEKRMVKTTDGKEMTTWVIYPPHFDPAKTYPAILYCQGGPQQAVSQFWSYRWNFALMASQGYIVIAPNRRGLPGFGTEWNAQISGDYPGQNMRDYLSAVDDMKRESYVDADHIGAVGASYGGFSVYWLAGHHDGRFAAFIAHAGIFNTEAQYLETEEMWFANWDLGGPFWDKDNAVAQRSFALSPHRAVDKWDTPIMITHGEYDFRILSSQGEMAFNAARLRGVPAEMVIFPDENHWILKPQNAVMWQRLFFRWLDRWLKTDATTAETSK
ncbi:MAG: S9 family peptidase [Muribaculaceae bacterium]|nr:S9 family peptidase [Muribaculaceae bacterium]